MGRFDILLHIILPFVFVGLFFFIINGIFKDTHHRTKLIVNLFTGIFLFLFLLGALLLDWLVYLQPFQKIVKYLAFPISTLIITIGLTITNYKRSSHGRSFYQSRKARVKKESVKRNFVKAKKEEEIIITAEPIIITDDIVYNVYVIFQEENNIILYNKGNLLTGFTKEFINSKPQDAIYQIISRYGFNAKKIQYIGQVAQTKQLILCYLVDISEHLESSDEFKIINKVELNNYQISEEDKELILRILIKEPFNIEK